MKQLWNKFLTFVGHGKRHKATRLTDSYVRHYDLMNEDWTQYGDNFFTGILGRDGYVVGTMINSYGVPSCLEGKIYRFLWMRLLIGRASNYPGFPDGAPYYKLSFITPKYSRGILLGQRGFVYIKLRREKLY